MSFMLRFNVAFRVFGFFLMFNPVENVMCMIIGSLRCEQASGRS